MISPVQASGASEEALQSVTVLFPPWHILVVNGSTAHRARVEGQLPPRLVTVFSRVRNFCKESHHGDKHGVEGDLVDGEEEDDEHVVVEGEGLVFQLEAWSDGNHSSHGQGEDKSGWNCFLPDVHWSRPRCVP